MTVGFDKWMFNDLFGFATPNVTVPPEKAPYNTNVLLDFLFDKHTAEYNTYMFARNAELESARQAEVLKLEEANRFDLDKVVAAAQSNLSKHISVITSKYAYKQAIYTNTYCLAKGTYVTFNTVETVEAFARVTGLSSPSSNITFSTDITGSELRVESFPIMQALSELNKKVEVLENASKVKNNKHLPSFMYSAWWKELALYAPK